MNTECSPSETAKIVTNIVALNSQTHRSLRVEPKSAAIYGDNQRFVPVVIGEFPFLVVHYPILFSKDAETGAFYCGAMLGFDEGENLFLDDKGHDSYRPLNLQRAPFYTVGDDLAIDLDSPRVSPEGSQALFDENGAPSSYLESIMHAMREIRPGVERTKVFIQTLMEHRLIEPIDIKASFDDGSSRQIQGLYSISRDSLKNLPDTTVLDLFRRGYLQLIYYMIASQKQLPVLAQRKNRHILGATATLGSGLS